MPIHIVLLIVLLNMTAFRGSKVIVTLFAIDLGASQVHIGALIAMYSVAPMLLALYAGKLADRLGVRMPMIAGTAGVMAALTVPYILPRLTALYLSAALIGATWIFYNVSVQNLIGALSDVRSRARNFSNYGLVMAGGSFFGPLLSGLSIDRFGFQQTYLHLAAAPFISVVVLLLLRSLPHRAGAATTEDASKAVPSNLLRNRPLRRTLVASAIVLTGTDLFQFYLPIYGHAVGLSASAIGAILGTFAVAAFVVRLAMPAMVSRWGAERLLLWSMYVGAAAYLAFPAFEHALALGALAFVLGLGLGCSQPLSLMLIYDRAPEGRSGEALGLRLTINNFMHIAIPLFFGSLGALAGVAPVFLANAGIMAAGGMLSRRAVPSRA